MTCEHSAEKDAPTPGSRIAGHVMSCHTTRHLDDWECSCPSTEIDALSLMPEYAWATDGVSSPPWTPVSTNRFTGQPMGRYNRVRYVTKWRVTPPEKGDA